MLDKRGKSKNGSALAVEKNSIALQRKAFNADADACRNLSINQA